MTPDELIRDSQIVALTVRQSLEPVEGRDVPLFPATYMKPDGGKHSYDTPYTINKSVGGEFVAEIDSVQSQANRMEHSFNNGLAWSIPQVRVRAGETEKCLTEFSHRIADAAVRSTELAPEVREAFQAYARGDRAPMVRLGPTSLVYGAWDSRDTRIKVPRVIASRIQASDVAIQTRSAQFSGSFEREDLGLAESEWANKAGAKGPSPAAKAGFAPAPSIDDHGGVLVRGPINQVTSIHLGGIRALDKGESDIEVAPYILSLALAGLFDGGREYQLRAGCWMVPDGPPAITALSGNGKNHDIEIPQAAIQAALGANVNRLEDRFGAAFGSQGERVVDLDPKAAKKLVEESGKNSKQES